MGLLGTMSAVGTALGPSLGGVLIGNFGWQAIFLVNLPLGLLAALLALHVGAALWHHFKQHDDVLRGMLVGARRKTGGA